VSAESCGTLEQGASAAQGTEAVVCGITPEALNDSKHGRTASFAHQSIDVEHRHAREFCSPRAKSNERRELAALISMREPRSISLGVLYHADKTARRERMEQAVCNKSVDAEAPLERADGNHGFGK
jgi:hypothetical protein